MKPVRPGSVRYEFIYQNYLIYDFNAASLARMSEAAALYYPPVADEPDHDAIARVCKAAGDPLRLQILHALRHDSYGVLELCRIFDVRQPALSHHLKVLAEAGLVCRRREGTSIFYRRALHAELPGQEALLQGLFATVDAAIESGAVSAGIEAVRAERADRSRGFFAENADAFAAQQELIAPPGQYLEQLTQVIDHCRNPGGTALELGPGEGWLLPLLVERFEHVRGYDNSPQMLSAAQRHCQGIDTSRLQLVCGDSRDAATAGLQHDLVVANMVLHHTPSPADVIADLAACLRPGGTLLINDLCAHDQGWAREACGDLWLGFEPDDLDAWAEAAGLNAGESIFLALRNGFRVQLRMFTL